MKPTSRLVVLLSIISSNILLAQNAKLDSLYVALDNHLQEDTNRVNTLIRICYFEYTSNPEKNKKHAEEAQRISEKIGFRKGVGFSLRYISLYYWVKGDYEQAASFAFKMLKVFEETNDEQGLAKAYTLMGLIQEEWNNFDKSKEYHLKSLALNQKAHRLYDVAYNYNSLGTLHSQFSKDDEAIEYFSKSLALRKQIKDEDGMSQSYINLGDVARTREQYDEAIKYFTMALPIAKKLGNTNRLSIISKVLGDIYVEKKEYGKGEAFLQEALSIAKRVGNKKMERTICKSLRISEQERGNYQKALEYAILEKEYQDSLFSEEKAKQLAEMDARYDIDKKEQAIQLLARDNEIKALWKNIFAACLVVILLSGFFYYRIQRSNAKRDKELLRAQEALNEKLKDVDKMKSHFFASISHEFRTPLTLIKGPIDQLLESPTHILTLEKARMIERNAARLLQLVNQLLDLSRLDAGSLQLENKTGDVFKFLRIIASSFESYAEQHEVMYEITMDQGHLLASFDQDKLEKIVFNLLSNAFKYTPDGGKINFNVGYETSVLTIQVYDSGHGISSEHLPRIFDRFYQVRDQQYAQEGTGIGLSLVKELVSLMQGTVEVVSEPGRGSIFTVKVPLHRLTTESTAVDEEAREAHSNKMLPALDQDQRVEEGETILIVEDNADMRDFIREHLSADYIILEAPNGREGLTLACREIPDLIISDIMMPQMDGITFCETIRKDERTSHIPVIMLTAKEGRESKLEGLETGADEYLTKPFDADELRVRIKNLIMQRHLLRQKFSQQVTLQPKNIAITSVDKLFLEKVENTIEKNLSEPEFGVPQLQDALAMSKTQLHRKMKALTDQAPGEFIRNYRLKRAAQLLIQRGGNVTEIAYAVGFGSLSYFTRSFKDLFGKSPSEYSQLLKQDN